MTETNLVDLLTAAGVLLANYWLYKLNGKFDRLAGRVDAMEKTQTCTSTRPDCTAPP